MKFFAVFWILTFTLTVHAYRSTGFEQINSSAALKNASKLGLVITSNERQTKKELLRLKKRSSTEFKEKLKNGLENPASYQSYLLEVDEGLEKVEKAKTIAKYILYKKVEANWKDLKLTVLNTTAEKDFKKFSTVLIKDLQQIVYLKKNQGYKFEVGLWGKITVTTNHKAVTWAIEFATKADGNRLEEGAEDIQIQEGYTPTEELEESSDF